MKRGDMIGVFLAGLIALVVQGSGALAEIQMPKPERTNAEPAVLREFEAFYAEIEAALAGLAVDAEKVFELVEEPLHVFAALAVRLLRLLLRRLWLWLLKHVFFLFSCFLI